MERKESRAKEVKRRKINKDNLLIKLDKYLEKKRVTWEIKMFPGEVFATHNKKTADFIKRKLKNAGIKIEERTRDEYVVGLDSGQWEDAIRYIIAAAKPKGWEPKAALIREKPPKLSRSRLRITPERPRIGR